MDDMIKRHFNCKLTISEEKEIAKIYQAGFSMPKIAYAYKLSLPTIRRSLISQKVTIRCGELTRFFDENDDRKILGLYTNGMNITEITEYYNLGNRKSIINSLKRSNANFRGRREYKLNESAFNNLNDEHTLYWLGFIYADSSVNDKSLRFGLASKDVNQLKKIKKFLDSTSPIKSYTSGAISVDFNSQILARRLQELGIISGRNKFHILKGLIPDNLAHHFIRGYLDGDGCISVNQQIVFLGQHDILQWIKGTLHKNAQTSNNVSIRQRNGICEISWGGAIQSVRIARYIYKDASIWMKRKKDIIKKWK